MRGARIPARDPQRSRLDIYVYVLVFLNRIRSSRACVRIGAPKRRRDSVYQRPLNETRDSRAYRVSIINLGFNL